MRRLLEVANRHTEMAPMLREFVAEIRQFTGCMGVAIRLLNDDLWILYQEAAGFSPGFCQSEEPSCS